MADGAEATAGFHGKLPAKGDFVTRRLPRGFVDAWDGWLQEVVGGSRARMNEAWLDAYLTSPIWRFVLSPGLCGERATSGVLMPSVDKVGRYFPLTVAAVLADDCRPALLPVAAAAWYQGAEGLARTALADGFDFDRFDADVAGLGMPVAADEVMTALTAAPEHGLRLPLADADAADPIYRSLAGRWLAATWPDYSLWWTAGSADMAATFIVCPGLPDAERFAAFLDGCWEQWGWAASPSPPATGAAA